MYKKAQSAFWTTEELDLTKDGNDWASLSDNERFFIKRILAFFAASDGIVNENLGVRFMNDVKIPEARAFYGFQIAMENIHNETYSLLIDTYISNPVEKNELFGAIRTLPFIAKKADWALRWISSEDASFPERLIAFACVEGIFFSGAFCSIFWMKERGLLPGLCSSNEFISRDEALHTEFAIMLYGKLLSTSRLSEKRIHEIVGDAIDVECSFIIESLPCSLLGMNALLMSTYVKFVGDRLLSQLGYAKLYNVRNPFGFMDRICLEGKANFFEHRESNYSKANVGGAVDVSRVLEFDEGDF
jgi:ribonucleotide reductase beta subunit family protein with ferritin-like domain